MNEQLRILIELQKVDDRRDELRGKLETVPQQLESLRAGMQKEQQALDELRSTVENSGKERRAAERELEAHEEKIRKLKEQQFMVKSNKEYQTMNHEIEVMENRKGNLEDAVLLMMDQVTETDRRIKAQEGRLAREREVFQREEEALRKVEQDLADQLAAADAQRAGILEQVTPETLRRYAKLKEFHRGRAVVGVIEGICQGCFIALRPQKYQEVKGNEEILTCDQCNRIIYHLESKDAGPPAASQEG